MSAFISDKFKFLGLKIEDSRVLAKLSEGGFLFRSAYTQDEGQVYSLLERTVELIQAGHTERILHDNRDQLLAAFNAIRSYKAQNGISLDIKNPGV